MQRESWKVFLACAIGAGLGSLVALEVHRYLWWVGLIAGGFTGYLSYEWRAVLRAIPAAYRAARGWVPDWLFWKHVAWWWLNSINICFYAFGLMFFLVLTKAVPHEKSALPLSSWQAVSVMAAITIPLCLLLAMFIASLDQQNVEPCSDAMEWRKNRVRETAKISYFIAPHMLFFWHLPRVIWWMLKRLPRAVLIAVPEMASDVVDAVGFFRRFAWQLFLRIHSEMRLLCGLDAMLGAAIGYFTGSALVGAVAGGLCGVLNYAVVTERWLKRRGFLPIRS